jgi:hypothetical protein
VGNVPGTGREKMIFICLFSTWKLKDRQKNLEEISCTGLINCTKVTEMRNLSTFLHRVKCKWENQKARVAQMIEEENGRLL